MFQLVEILYTVSFHCILHSVSGNQLASSKEVCSVHPSKPLLFNDFIEIYVNNIDLCTKLLIAPIQCTWTEI